ncbi:MAG: N-ATPase subunit AtpR [Planctomycetota bacterium]|jgi:F1F0 ATPase subunit 2
MSELVQNLGIGLIVGLFLGTIFFGGLWWTTQRLLNSPYAGIFALISLVVRLSILGGGLLAISRFGAPCLLAASAGSLVARQLFILWFGAPARRVS